MERFLKKKSEASSSKTPEFVDLDNLPSDPADRKPISSYNVNQRDEIRRAYILRGPCQPKLTEYPAKMIAKELRRFVATWYDLYPGWLEYSLKNDRAYCLCCYLFRGYFGDHKDTFVSQGYNNWKKSENLAKHVGNVGSLSSLSPCDNFSSFSIPEIQRLAAMYPNDFDEYERKRLPVELESYIDNVMADARFANLNGLSSLVQLMVETKKHLSFTLVYRLLKLALVLPVATATVERCFSGMKLVKSDLRNRIGDENLSDSLVCYVEKDLLRNVSVDDVMTRFHKMKTRRERL